MRTVLLCCLLLVPWSAARGGPAAGPDVVLENQGCRLVIGADGVTKEFHDKTLGEDRLARPAPFMLAVIGKEAVRATGIRREGEILTVIFARGRAEAVIECQEHPYFISLLLRSWKPQDLSSLILADLRLKKLDIFGASANYDERAAVGIQSLRYWGRASGGPSGPNGAEFSCRYEGKYGLKDAGCALIASPRPLFLKAMQEMEAAYGLPSPTIDGVWGKLSPAMRRSYFSPTDLGETNVEQAIAMAKRGHFDYILIREPTWAKSSGTWPIHDKNFPSGLEGLKAVVAKLKAAGFKVGLHFLCAGISPDDPLITPVPAEGVVVDFQTKLAADVDAKADFLPTAEPPKTLLEQGFRGHDAILRVDDELIQYGDIKLEPPYGFTGCRRGYLKTQAAPHKPDAAIRHLRCAYNLFLTDADSPLMDRVAGNLAAVVNACEADGVYFDGSEDLQGEPSYYHSKILMAYYEKFKKKDIIAQASSQSAYTWHLQSRYASADGAMDVKGYLDERSHMFGGYFRNFMPLDVGWYSITPHMTVNDLEYICLRALEFCSSVSIVADMGYLTSVPYGGEMLGTIARYEDLRRSPALTAEAGEWLRRPGQEYALIQRDGRQILAPAVTSPWTTWPKEGEAPDNLQLANPRTQAAQVGLDIQCGSVVGALGKDYDEAQPLELFETPIGGASQTLNTNLYDPAQHGKQATNPGVTMNVTLVTDDVKEGARACRFEAISQRNDGGGWATFRKTFDPPLDLKDRPVLGLWVKGDGKGEWLKVQPRDPDHAEDYMIQINFKGWRFCELTRPESTRVDYSRIKYFNLYYNNIPARSTVCCLIDGVKAMSQVPTSANPVFKIAGREVRFPVVMRQGERLAYRGPENCWLYPTTGPRRKIVPEGSTEAALKAVDVQPGAMPGTHSLRFRALLFWPESGVVLHE